MKEKVILSLYVILISSVSIYSQTKEYLMQSKTKLYYPKVTSVFEVFDTLRYQSIKIKGKNYGEEKQVDGTRIYMDRDDNSCLYLEYPANSCFYLKKAYYPNGKIKYKGLRFNYESFNKGIWYFFDEDGKLDKTENYDAPYKVSFERIYDFCKKEDIDIKTGYRRYISTYPDITRHYDQLGNQYVWRITKLIPEIGQTDNITIDATSGKILYRFLYDIYNDSL